MDSIRGDDLKVWNFMEKEFQETYLFINTDENDKTKESNRILCQGRSFHLDRCAKKLHSQSQRRMRGSRISE